MFKAKSINSDAPLVDVAFAIPSTSPNGTLGVRYLPLASNPASAPTTNGSPYHETIKSAAPVENFPISSSSNALRRCSSLYISKSLRPPVGTLKPKSSAMLNNFLGILNGAISDAPNAPCAGEICFAGPRYVSAMSDT